jgi:CheY-like chemotaxis protein
VTSSIARFEATILVVDDHPMNVRILEKMLLNGGCAHVVSLTNPHDVLATSWSLDPDLIILDLRMPEMDGFGVMERLRTESGGRLPCILVLTADATPESRAHAIEAGASDYMTKPFTRDELLERVEKLLLTQKATAT